MEYINVLKELNDCKGYEMALIATYTVDINFADKMIINNMISNECNKIILFVDKNRFYESIKKDVYSNPGSKYIINTIKTNNSFHPKIYLLLGKEKAKLIMGSGNLTISGMINNNEIFKKIEYDSDNKENLTIIKDAIKTIMKIKEINKTPLQESVFDIMSSYEYLNDSYTDSSKDNSMFWLDNTNQTIARQLKDLIKDKIISYDVITPYFDKKCTAVVELKKLLNIDKYRIFAQQNTSNLKPSNLKDNYEAYCFNKFNNNSQRYHGKVFIFHGENNDYILYGSANCSNHALHRTINDGNYESCILEKGEKGDFDYYFNFIKEYKEINTNVFSSIENTQEFNYVNTAFEWCVLSKEELKINLKQHKIKKIQNIKINDIKTDFKKNEKDINISINVNDLNEEFFSKSYFEINITEEKDNYTILGFYHNENKIIYTQNNRARIINEKIKSGEWDEDFIYILDIINEYKGKASWNYEEYTKSPTYKMRKQKDDYELNEEINNNPEDYVVNITENIKEKKFSNGFDLNVINIFYKISRDRASNKNKPKKLTKNKKSSYKDLNKENLKKQLQRLVNMFFKSLDDAKLITESTAEEFYKRNLSVLEFLYELLESEHYNNEYVSFENDNKKIKHDDRPVKENDLKEMYVKFLETIKKDKINDELTKKHSDIIYGFSVISILWLFDKSNEFKNDLKKQDKELVKHYEFKAKNLINLIKELINDDDWFRDNYIEKYYLLENYKSLNLNYSEKDVENCFEYLFDYESKKTAEKNIKEKLEQEFKTYKIDKGLLFLIKLKKDEKIDLSNGSLREDIKYALNVTRKVSNWRDLNLITITYKAETGNIIKYSITDYKNRLELEESFKYKNGNSSTYKIKR